MHDYAVGRYVTTATGNAWLRSWPLRNHSDPCMDENKIKNKLNNVQFLLISFIFIFSLQDVDTSNCKAMISMIKATCVFFSENRRFCVILCKIMYARQATVRFACGITEVTHCPRLCSNYCFPIKRMVTRTQRTLTLCVICLCCSTLRSIAVHIHSVFCVPCTVCGNVQQYADTATFLR